MFRRAVLIVAVLALAGPAAAQAALQVSAPDLEPVAATEFAVEYRVYARATGQNPHTRSEGAIAATVVSGEASDQFTGFIRDYKTKTKQLSLPNNPYARLLLTRGVTYSVRVANWLGGGGGCGTCGETGAGPPRTITVPGPEPKDRLPLSAKLRWSAAADRSFATAARLRLLTMLTFTSEAANALHEQAWREVLHAREARELAIDPVDRNYKVIAKARKLPKPQFDSAAAGAAASAIVRVLDAQGTLAAELEVVNTSIFRAQGAFVKKSKPFERRQMLNAATAAGRAAAAARALAQALPAEVAAFRSRYPGALDQTVDQPQAAAFAEQMLAAGGLPASDRALLRRIGATDADISLVTAQLLAIPFFAPVTGAALIAGADVLADLAAQAKLLSAFATRTKRAPTKPA